MSKVDEYRRTLRSLQDWDSFLLRESRLPGPRGNIELAQAVAEEGDEETFRRYACVDAEQAPANTPGEFLAFCGVLGLGRLLSESNRGVLDSLRLHASDPRWRTREAVAMALQRLGRLDMDALLQEMETWSRGGMLEQRAAVAALCEPDLLQEKRHVESVLQVLDGVTESIRHVRDRRSDEFKALRKGLGYCWSVAVAALPSEGKSRMERWFRTDDRIILWIMKENLKKARLERADREWTAGWRTRLGV